MDEFTPKAMADNHFYIPKWFSHLSVLHSPGAKLENGGLPYTESPLSFDGFD